MTAPSAELIAYVRERFGIDQDVRVEAGPRGALGQIWRLTAGERRYALKEIFREPPSPELIAAELAFVKQIQGVRVPASHPDRDGRYLLTTPGGTWLRLYDWVDLSPIDPSATSTPAVIGGLLARLHRDAPPTAVEPGGAPPDTWYDTPPTAEQLAQLSISDDLIPLITKADPAVMVMCHRDLHPENVYRDPSGALVVVDWDNLGPAVPARELAGAMFDWFADGDRIDSDAVRAMYASYVEAGGPGRVRGLSDFSTLLASSLNFLVVQARVANDPTAEQHHRDWAEREIADGVRRLPTPQQMGDVLLALDDHRLDEMRPRFGDRRP